MRSAERLDTFYSILKYYHKTFFMDFRFSQLIININAWYEAKTCRDIFYLEEDEFIKVLKEYIMEHYPTVKL